ncbi:MAG: FecR domain-containing protein, partial [Gammaproteobacteria bacterium]|nr:FecR domain-containing protein [Gammaproteobacteria bacterium]
PLPDGSEVRLNTNGRLEVNYSSATRALRLLQGEAFFQVAKDRELPFSVQAGGGLVVAMGTAFAIRLRAGHKVQVTVSEGRVTVAAKQLTDEPSDSVVEVVAGQTVTFERAIESVETLDAPEIERRLSWRAGMLMFNGDSLESVVSEVSRYTATKIVISDPEIRQLKVGGYFRAGDTEVLLRTLADDFEIEVDRVATDLVYLRSRTN